MNVKLIAVLGIIFLALIGVVGDFFIKLASAEQKAILSKWFFVGLIIYAVSAFGWVIVMRSVKLPTLGVLYAISTALFLVILGVFYFKEKLNIYEGIGILMGLISILLLAIYS